MIGKMKKKNSFRLLFLIFCIAVSSCSINHYTPEIEKTLNSSDNNRSELIKAINYFQDKGDSLQLRAIFFLIENLPHHSFYEIVPCDSTNTELEWNIEDYEDFNQARTAWDSLNEIHDISWKARNRLDDHKTVSADFLIQNVEDAFFAWQNLPWSGEYSYEIFLEFILPFRGSNEPIPASVNWRKDFIKRYEYIKEKMKDLSDPIEAASLINMELRNWFRFDEIYYLHPTDQSIDEMQKTCKGRCEDMTNLAMAAMRANGIAVTSDYTPHWADSGNNHAWNAIITHDCKAIPFMGCEADPGNYSIRSRVAKVYRKTFARQTNNLASLLEENDKAPGWLRSEHYVDVTDKYTNTADVTIHTSREIPDSIRFIYLCVFNSGEWRAIQWSQFRNSELTFFGMGMDLCYLPMNLQAERLVPFDVPLILEKSGNVRFLRGNRSMQDMVLYTTTKPLIANATEGKQIVQLNEGSEYELFFWQEEWQSAGKQIATIEPLIFREVPADRLYWLVETGSRGEERIFTYENGEQIWW